MSDLLQQLEDNGSVLLMYLAGELPGEDRAEVERRLAADPGLRDELRALRETHETVLLGLGRLDQGTPLPVGEAAAVRGAATAIRQWQADRQDRRARQLRPTAASGQSPSRWRVWAIPSSAAALVLVVLGLAFYGHAGKTRNVAIRTGDPLPPTAAATPQGSPDRPASPGEGATASSEDDDARLLLSTNTTELLGTPAAEEANGPAASGGPAGLNADRDGGHDDAGNRDEVVEAKPVFDIPLDAGP